MKAKICLTLLVAVQWFACADNITPLIISKAITSGGKAPRNYTVVHTTIQKNTSDTDSTPIVSRSVLGTIPAAVNIQLKVPEMLTDLQAQSGVNVTQLSGLISQCLGSLGAAIPDPETKAGLEAGAAATAVLGALVDQGLKITGKLLDKFYGKDPTLVSMIEILPQGYYTVADDKVNVTEKWTTDFAKLAALQKQYEPAQQAYVDAALKYQKAYNQWKIDDPYEQDETKIDALNTMYQALAPLVKAKLEIEIQLATLQPYRFALMAYNLPQVGTCGGVGSGPAILRLFVFLGAKQTNVYDIRYCVKDPSAELHANVELVLAGHNSKGVYSDGGIRLVCPDGTVSFQGLTSTGDLAYGYSSSTIFNWFDSTIASEGNSLEKFTVPFSIYKLRLEVEAAQKEAEEKADTATAAKMAKLNEDLAAATTKLKTIKDEKKEKSSLLEAEQKEAAATAATTAALKVQLADAEKKLAVAKAAAEKTAAEKTATATVTLKAEVDRLTAAVAAEPNEKQKTLLTKQLTTAESALAKALAAAEAAAQDKVATEIDAINAQIDKLTAAIKKASSSK